MCGSGHDIPTRTRIIDAAVVEFGDKGFATASMAGIASRAAMSKRTLYKHFDSKDRLFRALVTELADRVSQGLPIRYDPARSIRDQLTEVAREKVRLMRSPDLMAMSRMVVAEILRSPALAAGVQGRIDRIPEIAALFRDAAADGQLRPGDPVEAAEAFMALIKAQAFWPALFTGRVLPEEEIDGAVALSVEMILNHYRSGGPPAA